MFQLK